MAIRGKECCFPFLALFLQFGGSKVHFLVVLPLLYLSGAEGQMWARGR